MKFFIYTILALAFLQSCTVVTTTNIPGKTEAKFPKSMIGKYELQYPGELAALGEGDGKTTVIIEADKLKMINSEGETVSPLGDSLFVSKIGKQYYITLGASPSFSVFRVVKSGKDLDLFTMAADDVIDATTLQPYFSSVKEVPGEPDEETGEPGMSSYEVTIDDKKLDSYFKSDIPSKDPFKLKRVK